jgi:hypothetical protein
LHKNQDAGAIDKIVQTLSGQTLNSISFDDAATKTYFFHKVTSVLGAKTIYLDFDMLYSGYVASGILQQSGDIEILRPSGEQIREIVATILEKVSIQKHLVIIDSLNGLYAMLDQKDSGRFINSIIMLMVSIGSKTDSIILVGSISKFREEQGWVLSALGRRIIEIERMNRISIKRRNSYFELTSYDQNNNIHSSFQFDLDAI